LGDLYSGGLIFGGGGFIFGMMLALVHVVGLYTGGLYSGGLIFGGAYSRRFTVAENWVLIKFTLGVKFRCKMFSIFLGWMKCQSRK
jgi:hypothetical protein